MKYEKLSIISYISFYYVSHNNLHMKYYSYLQSEEI